ncbi:unnamed protein product [Hyaloperonospora brassicae]|uniref:KIF-binding protein n=1 Tax=Hyaloperonospora brassicae TaxID=162125 RepID=A0AAV0T8A7_HYABA|nr:unnamed protein product [Hyaloperonospora brassicae]
MERKRERVADDATSSPPPCKRLEIGNEATRTSGRTNMIDDELSSIDDLLQQEETSQRQTWQIGKRVKRLLERHEDVPISKQLDAYFLWGTALARLASLNEDPTLADAAADKFQQILQISGDGAESEDAVDAALGPVGYSLWGSSLLIVATETQSRQVLDQALTKFQRAVEVDGGTTFETRFQYAKALKEGGDLVAFLEEDKGAAGANTNDYYDRALQVCKKLEDIYQVESKAQENDVKETKLTDIEDGCNGEGQNGGDDDDDDKVTVEDFAEVKLLEAVLQGVLEDPSSVNSFYRTVALYQEAIALNPGNAKALMEATDYLAARCLASANFDTMPSAGEWAKLFGDLEVQYKRLLADVGFDLQECHEICHRKDTHDQNEPEEKEIDEEVPYLLNALGKGLAAFARSFPQFDGDTARGKKRQKQKSRKANGNARFTHAVEVLRSAHHFHDKLGCYYLACLYASPAFEDEGECRVWLETADSYGALEDEFDVQAFATMHGKAWFKHLAQPPALVTEIDGKERESSEEDDG